MRRRFFVERFEDGYAAMRGEAAHHLARVLRAEPGQQYELSDGREVWLAEIEGSTKHIVEFKLLEKIPAAALRLFITLLLSIVKFDRFEWALEKATELGVSEIVPLAAERSEKKLVAAAANRAARWQKILLESAQQSRRLSLPVLAPISRAQAAFSLPHERNPVLLILSESRTAAPLRQILEASYPAGCKSERKMDASPRHAVLAIGPEGGWTDDEFAAARAAGFVEVSLGETILRTETAVIAALATLNYALGE